MLVDKADGSLRMCVNYKKVNAVIVAGQTILPNIEDVLAYLPPNGSLFTKIDLKGAYNLFRMDPKSEDLTTFVKVQGDPLQTLPLAPHYIRKLLPDATSQLLFAEINTR